VSAAGRGSSGWRGGRAEDGGGGMFWSLVWEFVLIHECGIRTLLSYSDGWMEGGTYREREILRVGMELFIVLNYTIIPTSLLDLTSIISYYIVGHYFTYVYASSRMRAFPLSSHRPVGEYSNK